LELRIEAQDARAINEGEGILYDWDAYSGRYYPKAMGKEPEAGSLAHSKFRGC
jgi:hypothetical protein